MGREWQTLAKGVRFYESAELMADPADKRRRRPVRNFYLKYRHDGKVINEAVGPETVYTEEEVLEIAKTLERNRKDCLHPQTWTEWKENRNKEYEFKQEQERIAENKTFWKFFENVYVPYKERQVQVGKISEKYCKNLQTLCLWAKPIIGDLTFDAITSDHFDEIVAEMRKPVEVKTKTRDYQSEKEQPKAKNGTKRIYSYGTVKKPARSITTAKTLRAILHEVWNLACDKEYAHKRFPGREMADFKYDNKRTRTYTIEELKAIFQALEKKSIDTYHIAIIAFYTGLRAGSICNLTWGSLDDSVGRDPKNKDGVGLGMFKTNFVLLNIIEERKTMFPDDLKKDYLFKGKTGHINAVSKTFSRTIEDLGINRDIDDDRARGCFHTLRHTCASILVNNGMSLPQVAQILGHKTIQMTFRYAHHNGEVYEEGTKLLPSIPLNE